METKMEAGAYRRAEPYLEGFVRRRYLTEVPAPGRSRGQAFAEISRADLRPAQTKGCKGREKLWIPAFAGMTASGYLGPFIMHRWLLKQRVDR